MKAIQHVLALQFLLLFITRQEQIKYPLSPNWTLSIQGSAAAYDVTIPSTLADDLVTHKLVPTDPYYRDNFLQFYKYEDKWATYSTLFASPASSECNQAVLEFGGLDTHADVYFNRQLVLRAHNMYRKYRVEVDLMQMNNLTIKFNSSALYDI